MSAVKKRSTSTTNDSILSQSWVKEKGKDSGVFTSNDILQAYEKGKEFGKSEVQQILMEKIKSNIQTSTSICQQTMEMMRTKFGFECEAVHLRIDDAIKYDVLFIVDEEDYVSKDFLKVYDFIGKKVLAANNDTFHLSYIFMTDSEDIELDSMLADGFIYRYANGGK